MANSLTFNDVDLSAFGLTVTRGTDWRDFIVDPQEISLGVRDGAAGGQAKHPAKNMVIPVVIQGSTAAALETFHDSIVRTLNWKIEKTMALDVVTDRYWNALTLGLVVERVSKTSRQGTLTFRLQDPVAFANTATTVNDSITSTLIAPDTVTVPAAGTLGGSDRSYPLIKITATEANAQTVVSITSPEHETAIDWRPNLTALASGDIIAFECDPRNPSVTIDRGALGVFVNDMANVTGRLDECFLQPGETNSVVISGAYTAANIDVIFRERYL